jgi:RimJ/RimL family protein N-acetyltransferase
MDEIEIRTGNLLLRPWRDEDANQVTRACQDSEIHRFTAVPRPYLPQHAESFVAQSRASWAAGTAAPLGVFDAITGELLGSNGLITLNQIGGTAEIGYWMAASARARGVATLATHAVAAWGLSTLKLHRIAWRAIVGNYASRLVAERVGFAIEGILRNGGIQGPGGPLVDCWGASLIPGQLRNPATPLPAGVRQRAGIFGAAQPRLPATTRTGESISLRPVRMDDVDAIIDACRDAESRRWTTVPDPYHRPDAEFFVSRHGPRRWTSGEGAVFAIADAEDRYAGSIELRITGRAPNELAGGMGEVGFLIAPWARRRGVGGAALARVCRWGFAALGLRRIEWRAYVGNEASRATARSAGFTIEGTHRGRLTHHGEPRDAWVGAILAGDATTSELPRESNV